MEKSIENIWKEGFSEGDNLHIPQINSLYRLKSIHVIDRFKQLFRYNLVGILLISAGYLIGSYYLDMLISGIVLFVTLLTVAGVNKMLLNDLEQIDKGQNSYHYLRAFDQWIKSQIRINSGMSAAIYPVIFLSLILSFWYKEVNGTLLGEILVNKFLTRFPNSLMLFNIPVAGLLFVIAAMAALAFFGGRIYRWDLNLIYGNVLKKLEELLADLDNLNN